MARAGPTKKHIKLTVYRIKLLFIAGLLLKTYVKTYPAPVIFIPEITFGTLQFKLQIHPVGEKICPVQPEKIAGCFILVVFKINAAVKHIHIGADTSLEFFAEH